MMLSGDIPPNQTIYIKNLNEKVKKEELKRSLYCLFSQFGRILDLVALKTPKLRGQAWICFSEITAASQAVRQMQNFPFYDKPIKRLKTPETKKHAPDLVNMLPFFVSGAFILFPSYRIQYAKAKSDCIAKVEGTFVPKEKKKKQEEKADRKRNPEGAQQAAGANGAAAQNNGAPTEPPYRKTTARESASDPNNILFVQNLPHETTSIMLQMLFQQYPGFKEVRMIEAKPGIAFVEFEDDDEASVAMQALDGFKVTPQNPMEISYAKK